MSIITKERYVKLSLTKVKFLRRCQHSRAFSKHYQVVKINWLCTSMNVHCTYNHFERTMVNEFKILNVFKY